MLNSPQPNLELTVEQAYKKLADSDSITQGDLKLLRSKFGNDEFGADRQAEAKLADYNWLINTLNRYFPQTTYRGG